MSTYQEVIDLARTDLNDDSKVRYPDADLMKYANDFIQDAIKNRPDLFIGQFGCLPDSDAVLTDDFPLPQRHKRTAADYIIARARLIDTEDSAMQRSAAYLTLSRQGGGV